MAYCSVDVDAPYSGQPGEVLEATVTVTNLDTRYSWIFYTGIWAGTELIGSEDDMIEPGASKTYRRYFTMPDSKITILGWVVRLISWPPPVTVFCSAGSADVIPAVVPEYVGTISRKELEYDGARSNIPVY